MTLISKIEKLAFVAAAASAIALLASPTSAHAEGYYVNAQATTYNFPAWDRLNMRAWPASHSQRKFKVKRNRAVMVERCIVKAGSDWCLVYQKNRPWKRGWVNGRFIKTAGQNYSMPHHLAYGWH